MNKKIYKILLIFSIAVIYFVGCLALSKTIFLSITNPLLQAVIVGFYSGLLVFITLRIFRIIDSKEK